MRIFILLLLSLPFNSMAEENFDSKFKALKEELKEEEFKARKKTEFKSYPNDKYIEAFTAIQKAHMEKEFALRKEFCKTEGGPPCLSEKQTEELKSQYRVYIGVEARKNDWFKSGDSEEKVEEKVKAFTKCHLDQKDCDKLSEADRKIASVDEPAKKDEKIVEKKEEKKEDKKEVEKKEDKKEDEKKEDKKEDEKKDSDKKDDSKKEESSDDSEVKLEIPEGEKTAVKPTRKGSAGPRERKEVGVTSKSDEKKDDAQKDGDKKESAKDEKKEESKDDKKEEPEVAEESDDEKTPRNYKPETCRWVTDLPRKVVNGPGCGPKQRSKMCTGYVSCEQKQGGAKFIRMSTCSADKCGSSDEDAVRCTKDMGYYSMRPQGESKLFMTPSLKKVLSNGSTRQ
jgi:hypothetical protein